MGQFVDSYRMFRTYLGTPSLPMEFETWASMDNSNKSVALFVNFFKEINSAWCKLAPMPGISEEDGVETILQYLEKNVPIISSLPDRYYGGYIYRVAFNCLYRLGKKVGLNALYKNSVALTDMTDIDAIEDYIDYKLSSDVPEQKDEFYTKECSEDMWRHICELGKGAEIVARYMATGQSPICNTNTPKEVCSEMYKDSGKPRTEYRAIPKRKRTEIIKQLAELLEEYKDVFYD